MGSSRSARFICKIRSDNYALLMDHQQQQQQQQQPERRNENEHEHEHVIDIRSSVEAASSNSNDDRPSSTSTGRTRTPVNSQLSLPRSNISDSRNSSSTRRRRSPLNSGVWICIELVLTLVQIVVSVVVLSLSRHEHPQTPLFTWVVGYAAGCVASLPLLYWRFLHRNQVTELDSVQSRQSLSNGNLSVGVSFARAAAQTMEDENRNVDSGNRNASGLNVVIHNARLKASAEYFKMGLDCFFAIWFVVGNVWIFGGHASSSDAPNLYRLCVVFLVFSCIGYAMPFILCATICCCLPCIISVLGFREDVNQTRGATTESINSLPTYKFKLKKNRKNNEGAGEAGVVAAGTEKERVISGDDADCCICLAKYANNDELRELPCSHLFHKDCVDKWLKINALCPLCKGEVGNTLLSSLAQATASLR